MPKLIVVLLAGVLAVALDGSSCSGYGGPGEHHAAPAPPTMPRMSDDLTIGNLGIDPQQTQTIPRR